MRVSAFVIAALSALSVTIAVPADIDSIFRNTNAVAGFSLQQQAHGIHRRCGPLDLAKSFLKRKMPIPEKLSTVVEAATQDAPPQYKKRQATRATTTTSSTPAGKPKPTPTTSSSVRTSSTYATRSSSTSSRRLSSTLSVRLSSTLATRVSTTTRVTSTVRTSTSSLRLTSSSTSRRASSSIRSTSSKKIGSAVATPVNQYDTAYMIPITLGGKAMMVDIDTGSSDLWAFSNLQSSSQTANHHTYTVNSNNLLRGYTWNVTYYDGSNAAGLVYRDTISLGGATFDNQIVEAAQTASDAFISADYDGILGFAFDNLNTVQPVRQKTLFSNIMDQLTNKIFTASLKSNQAGSYDFGYIDPKKYTAPITYANVDSSQGWWQFTTSGYSVGSGAAITKSYPGVVDTGSTLLVLPPDLVANYYKQVSTAKYSNDYGAWIYPCSAKLPNLNFIISGAVVTLPGTGMTYGPIDYNGNCYGGLQQNDGLDVAIYGDIFIKNLFIVFDQDTNPPRVGFAKQAS